jgi:7,8-dihydroneopterin aldolase/epimerase/oxygenase
VANSAARRVPRTAMDEIRIEGLELACIVGVRPRERSRKQKIRLDVRLRLDASPAGRTGRIGLTCDYSRVADEAARLLRFRAYRLVEVATEELAAMLFAAHPRLEQVDLRLEKPQVFPGRARSASVRIQRDRGQFPTVGRRLAFGDIETVLETHEAGLYVVGVQPGRKVARLATAERQLAWITAGELFVGGRSHGVGDALSLPDAMLENRGSEVARVFLCTVPALDPSE